MNIEAAADMLQSRDLKDLLVFAWKPCSMQPTVHPHHGRSHNIKSLLHQFSHKTSGSKSEQKEGIRRVLPITIWICLPQCKSMDLLCRHTQVA